jgi:hypothetical protein
MEKDGQLVLNAADAKYLLSLGHKIINIREKREAPRETVFIFENTEEFKKDFQKMIKK